MKLKIIILLLILVNLSYSKDSLKVNAILYRLGTPTTLDKIAVINKETGVSFETNGNFISKPFLTDVKEDDNLSFYANIKKIDDKQFQIKFPNSRNNVYVKVYDYKGSIVVNESVYSDLNFKLPYEGIYFIVADNGREIIKKTINSYAMDISSISNVYPILKPNSIYTFIAYKKSFKPDTLADIDISTTDTLNFAIKDTSKYNFRSGTLEIKGLSVKTIKISKGYDQYFNKSTNTNDTTISKINIFYNLYNLTTDFFPGYVYGNCSYIPSTDSSVVFCYANYEENVGSESVNRKSSQTYCLIKIQNDSIKNITLQFGEKSNYNHYRNTSSSSFENKINILVNNLTFNLNGSSNFTSDLLNKTNYTKTESSSSRLPGLSSDDLVDAVNVLNNDPITITLTLNP